MFAGEAKMATATGEVLNVAFGTKKATISFGNSETESEKFCIKVKPCVIQPDRPKNLEMKLTFF